jgi:mannan endo-1,4-beta-mannosidase
MTRKALTLAGLFALLIALLAPLARPAQAARGGIPDNEFVKRAGAELRLNGKPFRFVGTNNYYLMYKSPRMVDDVLQDAADAGFDVVRMWGSLEIGNQDGSNSIHHKEDGVYFQYWDPAAGRPAFNDGPDGLQRLDYAVAKAGSLGIRLVIPFVNNWNAFGGMDQYVRWRGGQYHDQFYTDPVIRQWYKDWISHLLNRTNTITGRVYKDDPTIMTWELANEPRCLSAGAYPRSASCSTQTLIGWADEMSTFVRSIDNKHLISVGDEGFYCIPGAADWTDNCGEGVDTLAFAALKNIDVMSLHLYPDHWGKDVAWGVQWIERHAADARRLKKAVMLGEFGLLDKSTRNPSYKLWNDAVLRSGMSGSLYWILSGVQDDGTLYADYDGFTVFCPSPVCTAMSNFEQQMDSPSRTFAPVADNDSAVTPFNVAATLAPLANDIAYGGATLAAPSLDLDPAAAGRQTQRTVAGGAFSVDGAGLVTFQPAAGFVGTASAAYTVADSAGRTSNPAALAVVVKPDPTAAIRLFSFETGVEGWAPGNWQGDIGSVAQTTAFATDGVSGLAVTATGAGGWFGVSLDQNGGAVNLSGKSKLKYDLQTGAAGTSTNIAIKVGSGYTWCQGTWGYVNSGATATVELDLISNLSCGSADLSQVHELYIWFSPGTFAIDNIRAE